MHNLLLVAKREYLEQVRGRAFRLTTVLVPALFALMIGVGYLSSRSTGANKHLVIASPNAELAKDIQDQLLAHKDTKTTVDVIAPSKDNDRDALVKQVSGKEIDGFLWIETPEGHDPVATYEAQSAGDFVTQARLESAINHSLIQQRLAQRGVKQTEADALLARIEIKTLQVNKEGKVVKSNAQTSFWKGYVMAILLSMTTMIYGMNVARSIIQEKTSRIFEVMLSTAKPSDLLAGKLIGVGAVGLTQIGIWVVAAVVLISLPLAAPLMSGDVAIHISWAEGILFPVYFVLGYLLYSSLFAGLAATCETEQELQMYTPMAAVPIWLSFALIVLIINDSNSFWSVTASMFPPCAPIIMFLRMGSSMPQPWEFALSISLMILSIIAVLWFSTKLYRVGILMYGKRATLPEMLRWLRYS